MMRPTSPHPASASDVSTKSRNGCPLIGISAFQPCRAASACAGVSCACESAWRIRSPRPRASTIAFIAPNASLLTGPDARERLDDRNIDPRIAELRLEAQAKFARNLPLVQRDRLHADLD